MKRLASFAAVLALSAAPLLLASPAAAAPSVSCDEGDDGAFSFESYDADFFLDTDADGRSTLTTVETFVALFPDIDQNQGMRRAIPLKYQGHPTDISVQSVTDGEGNARSFTTEDDDGGEFLLVTSRADECVHGAQTYVFTYTQHNVTLFPDNSADNEFYWDTNGTGSDQPYGSATSRIHVPAALAASLTGDTSCYRGYAEGEGTCDLERADEDGGVVFTTSEQQLAPRENVTVDIVFEPGTFVPRDDAYFGSPFGFFQVIGVLGSAIAAVWAGVLRRTALADGRGRPTIIAEYSPPDGMDPFTASVLLKKTGRAAAAAFVDLAVKRRIRIVETPNTGFLARGNSYLLELVDPTGLEGPELGLAQALFGYQLTPGTGYLMSSKDSTLSERVRGIIQSTTAATAAAGLRKNAQALTAIGPVLLAIAAGVGSFIAGVTMLDSASGGWVPFALLFVPVIAVLLVFRLVFRSPLTDTGGAARPPEGARALHPSRRGRPAADAAEPDRGGEGGERRQDLREAPAVRGALRLGERVGAGARHLLRRRGTGLLLGRWRIQRGGVRGQHRLDVVERGRVVLRELVEQFVERRRRRWLVRRRGGVAVARAASRSGVYSSPSMTR